MTTLILCSTMPESQTYYREAMRHGEKVIATSSVTGDPADSIYEHWEWLPNVYDDKFLSAINDLIARHRITQVYCPHDMVHLHLKQLTQQGLFTTPIQGDLTMYKRAEDIHTLCDQAREAQAWISQITEAPPPEMFRLAAMLRQAESVHGESSISKQISAIAAFHQLPAGDIVEVGSLWGKMAVLLLMLARDYHGGSVLCVDPWEGEPGIQKDSSEFLQLMPKINDWKAIFTGFIVHTAIVAQPGRFNYLKMPSLDGEKAYRGKRVTSAEFGTVKYQGNIALIHIDGNHDYDCVRADYDAWRPHIASGGWIILDDYVWNHGDGPRRTGDEVLQAEARAIKRSFVSGKALFLQFH